MANRKNTFLIKRSNVAGKVPADGDLQLGELALNTADNILYASGTTANSILPIGWDRVARTGDTMTGYLYAPSISATTISATTYYNLPTDIFTTGGTYSNITGIATFTNNSGGTFNVAGFSTGGGSVFTGGTVTGPTVFIAGLTANTISATTYFNLPTDVYVTGGTYSSGSATFTNNTGGTFNVTGLYTGYTAPVDVFTTGATYSNNTFTYTNNTGGTFDVLFNTMTGLTVTGDLIVSGNTQSIFSGNSSSDLVRITQTGSGNALVIEDSTNPDSTPFVVNTSGFVGIGVTSPTNPLHISGSTDQIKLSNGSSAWTVASKSNGDFVAVATGSRASMYFGSYGVTNSVRISSTSALIVNSSSDSYFTGVGNVIIYNGLSANTISATTYFNLPTDIRVTGGTYSNGTAQFTNNTGGTFNVTGFSTSNTTAFTGGTVSGATNFTNGITANTISATTYFNLPTDVFVTGGTYTSGNAIFTNNTGGTFTVSGFNVGGGGGQVFYLNLSQSQNGNRLLSTTASTASEQTSGVTIANGVTSTIASFQSQPLNITLLPGGVWSFYLHSYKQDNNASFNIFVEVYKRTSGGTETLLFATDPAPVTTNSPNPSMQLSDGYFSGTSLNVSDSVVAVVRATNTDNQSHTITLVTEGSTHYSYVVSTIPTQQGLTCDTLSGCSIIQTIQTDISNKFDKSGGTVNGATNFTNGLSATTISATTYYNLPTDVFVTGGTYSTGTTTFTNSTGGTFTVTGFNTGTTTGNGTANYLAKWTGSTGQANSQIRDDGTNIAIGMAPDTDNKFSIITYSNNYYGLWVRNASSISGAKGIYGLSNGNVGTQTGVWGVGEGHPTTGTSIGVDGGATDGLLGIGVRGIVGTSEFGSMVTGIGGYFDGRGDGGYGYPSISYSVQLLDGTEGINKVLISKTSDGKANWSSVLSGLTGVYTNTLSATTYYNLPTDIRVTGGTYTNGTATFVNNTGGTFTVTGFSTGGTSSTDTFVTGATYSNNTFTYRNNTGGTFNVLFNTVTGLTSSGTISTSVLSATTYQNLPTDVRVTGGTYSSGTATFTNNTGGTFTVTGFSTGGGTFTGGTVSGATYFTGGVSANTLTASGTGQNILTVIGSGNSTTSPIFSVVGSQGELFSVTDSLTGSLFSVNDISGLPILEVFSDNTTLMGSYQAPSLNTTKKVSLTAGTNTVYSIPTSGYTGAFFDYTVISSTGARAGTIMSIWSGTTAQSTDVSTNDIGTTAGITFSVAVVGSNAVLSSSATTTGWTLKTIIRSI